MDENLFFKWENRQKKKYEYMKNLTIKANLPIPFTFSPHFQANSHTRSFLRRCFVYLRKPYFLNFFNKKKKNEKKWDVCVKKKVCNLRIEITH